MFNNLSAKNKTLAFVTSVLMLFLIILMGVIYSNQRTKLESLEKQYFNNIKTSYKKILEKHKEFYEYRLKANINSKGVKEALAHKDRKKLYDLVEGRWEVLKKENKYLKIMHFHLPNGESFLRMHKPEKYGDNIASKRAMAAEVHKLQKPLYGFEAGIYMLAYRTFIPIFYKNKYIGAVEIGSRPDQILQEMNYYNSIQGALFVKDDKIVEYRENNDLDINGFNLQYSTIKDKDIISSFAKDNKLDTEIQVFEHKNRFYSVYVFNLGDYNGKTSAKAIFFHDMTIVKTEFKDTLEQLLFLIIGLLGLLILVINLGFKGIIEKIEKTNHELDQNKSFTDSILNNSAHAIIAADKSGVITLFNKKAQKLLSYSKDEIIGKVTPELFHKGEEVAQRAKEYSKEFGFDIKPGFEVFVAKTNMGLENDDEWIYIDSNGREFSVSLHITALRDTDGNIDGYLGIAEDITQKKQLEKVSKKQKDELEAIFNTTTEGIAILDLQTNFLFFNNAYLKMTGFTKDELLQKSCAGLSAPEDIEKANKVLGEVLVNGHVENFEKTCIVKDGKRIRINTSISLMPDKQSILISAKDITEAKRKEEQIQKYVKLVDRNIITSSTDLEGNITYVSEAFCKISGYEKEELMGKNHRIIRHPDMPESVYKALWKSITSDKTWEGEIKNLSKDNGFYWVKASISPIFNEFGEKIAYTAIRQDITDKKRIEEISITDGLTDIYNRRYFNDIFPKIINSTKRDDKMLSFLIMDIDHFKQYNDTYGHQMGDHVLIKVAGAIKNCLKREGDLCFRLGGEEFGVVFTTDTKEQAIEFSNSIRNSIEDLHIEHSKNSVSSYVTASMGLVCENANRIFTDDQVYKQADDFLYKAKETGRNKLVYELRG